MIEYIYIVKCPGCEDEMFNFFTDARMQCDLLMSKKPYITQIEVERNDFGECTDHHDLGTVWSWEEAMKDTEDGCTDAEPATSIFTKDDFKLMADGKDPEFDAIDNSVDFEPETSEVSSTERKPIPEGMTIEQLVEEMEENEDTVECVLCQDLFDKSTCRKELNLGWLCSRCEMAIKSRGETLTFRENNYWDFLDEKLDLDSIDFSKCVNSSDMEIWGLEHTREDFYKAVLLKRFKDVSFKGPEDEVQKIIDEMYDIDGMLTFSFGKDGLPVLNAWNVNLLRKLGRINIEFEDIRYEDAAAAAWGKTPVREEIEELHDLGNEYDGGYPEEKPELSEIDEASDSHLAPCPECGKETFDMETGICVECGFN